MRSRTSLLVLVLCGPGFGADYFVARTGNDFRTGKLAAPNSAKTDGPFASIARAQEAVRGPVKSNPARPGTIALRGGTYYLPATLDFTAEDSGTPNMPEDSGTANMPVTWENSSRRDSDSKRWTGGRQRGSKNPVAGFDYTRTNDTRTNDTIRNAGRDHPLIHPPKVPHTFPTYTFTEF